MLNRFQFARLRAFRFGGKKATQRASPQGGGKSVSSSGNGTHSSAATATEEVTDRWEEDDDRVARLLERRRQEQDAERQQALDRMGAQGRLGNRGAAGDVHRGDGSHGGPATRESAPGAAGQNGLSEPNGSTGAVARDSRTPSPVDFTPPVPADRRAEMRTTTAPALERSRESAPVAPTRAGSTTGARVVCIASGKGGTGKSVLASNLAILRARAGERVLLIDFDAGLANAHLLLGLAPPYDVGHVMEGEIAARDALVEGPHGLKLLAGGVGRQVMIDPTRRELDKLFQALRPLESEFDLILIDHGAGLGYSTVAHLAATSTLLLVTNHEVTALSDGYALYKRAHMVNHQIRVGLVVNRAPDERLAHDAWERFRSASHKFLGHAPEFIGWVPADPAVPQAVQMRSPAVLSFPECAAAAAFARIGAWGPIDHARTTVPFFERARRALR